MPTIPKWTRDVINEEHILGILQKIQKGEKPTKEDLIIFVRLINNSIVGTSKVLHFIAPDYIPILDSKVLENWNSFFKNTETATFPKNLIASNQIRIYLKCWQLMEEWQANCKKAGKEVSLRDLEKALFELGKYR
jgi:hypothetical protein